jgi:glycosyltransferase involved in cell wall biosynthesis
MRICSPHCGIDPESASGGETYERELLRRLAEQGTVIDIVLARHKRHPEDVANWVVHRLPMGRGLRWPVAMVVLPPIIGRLHRDTRFDLLRAHSLRYIGPAALIARRRYRIDAPIVAHHHHLDPGWLNPLVEGRVMRAVDRVVVGSRFAKAQAWSELGVPAEQFSVVPYGVDRVFRPRPRSAELVHRLGLEGKSVALFLGGLKPRKNLFFLLDVWRAVVAERADAVLLIVGSGPLRARLERHARDLVRERRVIFTGYVPEREKVEYYTVADLLLFPSSMEGFGLTVAEAMSCELPVVASNRGSLPELYEDGEGGFLCDPEDVASVVRSVLLLLSDRGLRAKFGAANRERVDRMFRWEHCVTGTRRVYEEILDEWRRRRTASR